MSHLYRFAPLFVVVASACHWAPASNPANEVCSVVSEDGKVTAGPPLAILPTIDRRSCPKIADSAGWTAGAVKLRLGLKRTVLDHFDVLSAPTPAIGDAVLTSLLEEPECRITPAILTDGKVASCVELTYTFHPSSMASLTAQIAQSDSSPLCEEHVDLRTANAQVKVAPQIDSLKCAQNVHFPSVATLTTKEGAVVLDVDLDRKGIVTATKTVRSGGPHLDEAAVDALRFNTNCRFTPAFDANSKPVCSRLRYTFHFAVDPPAHSGHLR